MVVWVEVTNPPPCLLLTILQQATIRVIATTGIALVTHRYWFGEGKRLRCWVDELRVRSNK